MDIKEVIYRWSINFFDKKLLVAILKNENIFNKELVEE